MLRRYEADELLAELARRREASWQAAESAARAILADVRDRGDAALFELTERFDGVDLRRVGLEVTPEEWAAGCRAVPDDLRQALARAAERVRRFHEAERPRSWWEASEDGVIVGQLVSAVDRAGIYVPGGQAPLYSCLLMTAIPARQAGVREVIACTPPQPDGRVAPALLEAARLAGVDRIFKLGGAQAIAAMAHGTETVPPVDLVSGPGNAFVTAAKRIVYGVAGVDMLAGPTELVVVDDGSAPADWLAADLLAQAEHRGGTVVLVALDQSRVRALEDALEACLGMREMAGAEMVRNLFELGGAVVVEDLAAAVRLVNALAPEHLELAVREPWSLLPAIRHAGAIFLGAWTPEVLGDYLAGPSNAIPTGGAARYASPVGVATFLKRTSLIAYGPLALGRDGPAAIRLADGEGLPAHAHSVRVRLDGGERSGA